MGTMTYRGDLEAARARIEQLERELTDARRTIAELEAPKTPQPPEERRPRPREPRRLGQLTYTPPVTYIPLLRLVVRGPRVIRDRIPSLPATSSNSLLVLAGRALVWPLFHLLYIPAFLAVMYGLVLPWASVVALVGSLVVLPVIVLSRVTVGPGDFPSEPTTWFQGKIDDATTAGFLFFSVAPAPILYPFTMPFMMVDD